MKKYIYGKIFVYGIIGDIDMETIKIGRKVYDIQKGDYIMYNQVCYQFCSGDGRILKMQGWNKHPCLLIPKIRIKEIPFDKMKKEETGKKEDNTYLCYWYF